MYTKISDDISVTETADSFMLVISPALKPIVKYNYILFIIIFVGMFFLLAYLALIEESIVLCALCFLCAWVSILYIKRASRKEIINISKTTISLTLKDLIETKYVSYLITDISHLQYIDENVAAYRSVGEQELQVFMKNGTIEFSCQNERIRFGMEVPSWYAEEIILRIEKFTGNNFQVDDAMEELLNALKNNDADSPSEIL